MRRAMNHLHQFDAPCFIGQTIVTPVQSTIITVFKFKPENKLPADGFFKLSFIFRLKPV